MYSKTNKKKLVIISSILLGLVLFTTGLISAFYSDIFGSNNSLTTGTLELNGQHTYTLNGTEVTGNITNLNPGDVLVVNASATNIGNKSAWIRTLITLTNTDETLLPFLSVYETEVTQATLMAGGVGLDDLRITLTNNEASSGNSVINGTGTDAETEEAVDGYDTTDYLGTNTYNYTFTIYFSHLATNATQNKTFTISVQTQALQYRNNTTQPSDSAWQTVVAV